jgi:hypothetical protein
VTSLADANDVPLREYIEALLAEQRRAVDAALAAAEKAVTKAEVASDKRFEGVNEFRQALSDQTATFVPRTEWQSSLAEQERRLRLVEAAATGALAVRTAAIVGATLLIALIGLAAALYSQ